jgi:hypothetical protein
MRATRFADPRARQELMLLAIAQEAIAEELDRLEGEDNSNWPTTGRLISERRA